MRDNHIHSNYSYDSNETLENYLKNTSGEIITTEHFDLSNPYTGQDDVPDYVTYSQEIERLNSLYGNRLKKGIEIGYYQPRESEILDFLKDKEFDLKLLSVHHNGRYDYLQDEVLQLDKGEVIRDYLARLEYAIGRVPADVLAHFDYGFRKFELSVADLSHYEKELCRIFQKMIEQDLAFEINTKSMYLYGNQDLYVYALGLLKNLGCQKYSIGSDAHKMDHFCLGFEDAYSLLASLGISEEEIIS
ncbi:PHP domain-containing protein [Streptococcus cameli]